jgi:hypothetical protein
VTATVVWLLVSEVFCANIKPEQPTKAIKSDSREGRRNDVFIVPPWAANSNLFSPQIQAVIKPTILESSVKRKPTYFCTGFPH